MGWRIPVADVRIGEEEVRAVTRVMETGWLAKGEAIEQFEEEFARKLGVRHAVTVCNGTAAVEVALRALGLDGTEVLTSVHSCAATLLAMLHGGVRPTFADIDLASYNMDPGAIESRLSPETAGILAVHCYGRASAMRDILAIADRRGLPVIEDCAMALGASVDGRQVGTFGTVGVFSFYGNKIITTGEGGMVVTNDESIARKARIIRNYGQEPGRPFVHVEYGYNFKMSNVHAAIGLGQLDHLEGNLSLRRHNASALTRLLTGAEHLTLPPASANGENVYFCYPLLTDPGKRDRACERLHAAGIETRIMFPPLVDQPFYRRWADPSAGSFPVAQQVAAAGFYVGCASTLTDESLEYLANTLRSAVLDDADRIQ